MANDPTLRAVLEAARAWGVSLSKFSGARHVTTFEYNSVGQIARTLETPEWTQDDREAAMALTIYEASLCPASGLPAEQCHDPNNEDRFEVESVLCHGTVAREIASKQFEGHKHPDALLTYLSLKDLPDAAELQP